MFIETLTDEAYFEFQLIHSDSNVVCENYLSKKYQPRTIYFETTLVGYVSVMNPLANVVTVFEPTLQKHFLPIRTDISSTWISHSIPSRNSVSRPVHLTLSETYDIKQQLLEVFLYDIYVPSKEMPKSGITLEYT